MPAKFDDLAGPAGEVLDDDYKTSGYQFQAAQKTSFFGAALSTDVEFCKDAVVTPATLTWELPKPFGFSFFAIDKLELDKSGGITLEASSDKVCSGLEVNVTSDCKDLAELTAGATYTGIKDTQVIVDTKVMNPQDVTCEVTRTQGPLTLGAKYGEGSPDFALNFTYGPLFMAAMTNENFATKLFAAHYEASPKLQCAASYTQGGDDNGNFSVGAAYSGIKDVIAKAKVEQDMSVSCSLKYTAKEGFTPMVGLKYDQKKGVDFGLQLTIE